MKILLPISFVLCLVCLFVVPQAVFAKIWINEFSSNGSNDWIELYNDKTESVNLEELRIRDGTATNKLDFTGQIDAEGFAVFEWGSKLNNSGDTIKLVSVSDENTIIDQVAYGNAADITAPEVGQSAGRKTNGGSEWVLFASASKDASNSNALAAPTATTIPEKTPTSIKQPTPTRMPTPTRTPTPKKTPTPKPASVSTESKDDTETATIVPVVKAGQTRQAGPTIPKISGVPTSILGMATQSGVTKPAPRISGHPEKKVLVQSALSPPNVAMIAGLVFCAACGILIFLKKYRQNNNE